MKKLILTLFTLTSSLTWAAESAVSTQSLASTLKLYQSKTTEIFRSFQLTGLISARLLKIESQLSKPYSASEKADATLKNHLYQELFKNPQTSARLFSQVDLEIKDSAPCLDAAGNATDASSKRMSPPKICISTQRLAVRLNSSNYELELLALYVHEVSILLGVSEVDAMDLQKMVLQIGPNFRNYLGFISAPENLLRDQIAELHGEALKVDMDHGTDQMICQQLNEIYSLTYQLFDDTNVKTQQIVSLPMEDIIKFHAAFVAAGYAKDFCENDISLIKVYRRYKFKGQTTATMASLYPDPLVLVPPFDKDQILKLSQYLLADLAGESVTYSPKGQRFALKMNLTTFLRLTSLKD
jgi:hypothetical protein